MDEKIFVTDFDGTMTRYDFYRLAVERLVPKDCYTYWDDYRNGELTHFDALNGYFKSIRAPEKKVLELLDSMQLDPRLASCVRELRAAGWRVVVASAGCSWYIDKLLSRAGVELEVHANPGSFDPATGLVMQLLTESHYYSRTLGIDKAQVVRDGLQRGATVAFAGDGFPDADAAKLVTDELRFAKSDLASLLTNESIPFNAFDNWSDAADRLLAI
jgi:2-hydroxy-3-keto-5-methylthiopentenyl-1-phosphate phosphatase